MNPADELFSVVTEDDDDWAPLLSPLDLLHSGYVRARFGTIPVLLTPDFERRVRAVKASA